MMSKVLLICSLFMYASSGCPSINFDGVSFLPMYVCAEVKHSTGSIYYQYVCNSTGAFVSAHVLSSCADDSIAQVPYELQAGDDINCELGDPCSYAKYRIYNDTTGQCLHTTDLEYWEYLIVINECGYNATEGESVMFTCTDTTIYNNRQSGDTQATCDNTVQNTFRITGCSQIYSQYTEISECSGSVTTTPSPTTPITTTSTPTITTTPSPTQIIATTSDGAECGTIDFNGVPYLPLYVCAELKHSAVSIYYQYVCNATGAFFSGHMTSDCSDDSIMQLPYELQPGDDVNCQHSVECEYALIREYNDTTNQCLHSSETHYFEHPIVMNQCGYDSTNDESVSYSCDDNAVYINTESGDTQQTCDNTVESILIQTNCDDLTNQYTEISECSSPVTPTTTTSSIPTTSATSVLTTTADTGHCGTINFNGVPVRPLYTCMRDRRSGFYIQFICNPSETGVIISTHSASDCSDDALMTVQVELGADKDVDCLHTKDCSYALYKLYNDTTNQCLHSTDTPYVEWPIVINECGYNTTADQSVTFSCDDNTIYINTESGDTQETCDETVQSILRQTGCDDLTKQYTEISYCSIISTTPTQPTYPTLQPTSEPDDLSTGSIVGIVIAVVVVIIICVLIVVCIFKGNDKNGAKYSPVAKDKEIAETMPPKKRTPPPFIPQPKQIQQTQEMAAAETQLTAVVISGESTFPPTTDQENVSLIENKKTVIRDWIQQNTQISESDASKYADIFIENGFDDLKSLKELTKEDLVDIGISKLGHRKAIINAIQSDD